MASLPPSYRPAPPNVPLLRGLIASRRILPHLLKVVRSEYRRQRRHPLYEPTAVTWIEQYVKHVQGKRLGTLGQAHAVAFLNSLGATRPRQMRAAREAISFFHADLLQRPLLPIADVEPTVDRSPDRGRADDTPAAPVAEATRSFWTLDDEEAADEASGAAE